jgi:hypothetical protein
LILPSFSYSHHGAKVAQGLGIVFVTAFEAGLKNTSQFLARIKVFA